MKRISIDDLIRESKASDYSEQYCYIRNKIEACQIKPVKNSPLNGKTPALHTRYWLIEPEPDYTAQVEELQYKLSPSIRTDYYLNHLDVYQKERKWVWLLSQYFKNQQQKNPEPVSLNERSFQIWGREKFLQREQGKKILAHCGVSWEQLFVYTTTEPLAYYSAVRQSPQTVLILENKDTFYSMRKYLLRGAKKMFGEEIGTVIYGAGKGILRSFSDFRFCVEPHINDPGNRILYFGDLDYEGIGIYERLYELFCAEHEIVPFVGAYEAMLQKAGTYGTDFLPEMSKKQNQNIFGQFYQYFSGEMKAKMKEILKAGKYIPQEILNIWDMYGGAHAI
ncbi:MAG: hypothetical protein HFJ05_06420 [Eubacterium sp.]|nr:hypothetical protein [Eubacterium sp.]